MKVLLALAVLATSATALADSTRSIYDIMYLPNSGTTYGFTTGSYIDGGVEADSGDYDYDGYGLSQTIGHSFTDRLSVEASLVYLNAEIDPDGGSKTEQTGISDPTISARFRTMDEKFQWDLIGGASIGLGDAEQDDDGDQNNLKGGNALFIGTQFGAKADKIQWAVGAKLTHNMESTTDFDSAGDADFDAFNELKFGGDILNQLAEKSFLRSFVSVDFAENKESDDLGGVADDASYTAYGIGTEYQHLCSANLLLRAGIDYTTTATETADQDSNSVWSWNVGANYQF